MASSQDAYEFDDMPKKFKRLIKAPQSSSGDKKVTKDIIPSKGKRQKQETGELEVKPGESFRDFNRRLMGHQDGGSREEVGSGKNFKQKIAQEFSEARGIRSKRKEHLKERDRKRKKGGSRFEDAEEYRFDDVTFGERVEAPPTITAKPKTLKAKPKTIFRKRK